MDNFSKRLRLFRRRKAYNQAKMADLLGVKPNTISNYESGVSQPDLDTLTKIVKILDVSPGVLLGLESYQPNSDSLTVNEKPPSYEILKCQQCDLRERLIKSHEKTIAALESTLREVVKKKDDK